MYKKGLTLVGLTVVWVFRPLVYFMFFFYPQGKAEYFVVAQTIKLNKGSKTMEVESQNINFTNEIVIIDKSTFTVRYSHINHLLNRKALIKSTTGSTREFS